MKYKIFNTISSPFSHDWKQNRRHPNEILRNIEKNMMVNKQTNIPEPFTSVYKRIVTPTTKTTTCFNFLYFSVVFFFVCYIIFVHVIQFCFHRIISSIFCISFLLFFFYFFWVFIFIIIPHHFSLFCFITPSTIQCSKTSSNNGATFSKVCLIVSHH